MFHYLLQVLIILTCAFAFKFFTYLFLKPLRYYCLFIILRIICQDVTTYNRQLNWDIMWTLELVHITWINYIICKFYRECFSRLENNFILRVCPYIVGIISFLHLPFFKTGAQMCSFELHSLGLSLIILLMNLLSFLDDELEEIAICTGLYLCFQILCFLLWQFGLYNQKSFLLAELLGFLLILWSVFRYEVHSDIARVASLNR